MSSHSYTPTPLAQHCRIRARPAAPATVRALGRTRLGRPRFPTDSVGQRSKRPVPVPDIVLSAFAEDTTKIQGARSEARAQQRLAPGGRSPHNPYQYLWALNPGVGSLLRYPV